MAMPLFTSFIFSLFFFSFILSLSSTSCIALDSEVEDENPFSYTEGADNGPGKWGEIDPHWKACNNGQMQSPIDLPNARARVFPNLGKLQRNYKQAPAHFKNRGHDISVFWKGDAGEIKINGTEYKLIQCHWHSPSEHTFNGSRYAMELHAVHMSSNGNIAVIAIVYKYGHPDRFLSKVFQHIKGTGEKEEKEIGIVNPGEIQFGSRKYYRYIGSLTVPPCTEGVIWTIVKKVRTVSRKQVKGLREAVHDGYEANSRPTQSLDGRRVYLYSPAQ